MRSSGVKWQVLGVRLEDFIRFESDLMIHRTAILELEPDIMT